MFNFLHMFFISAGVGSVFFLSSLEIFLCVMFNIVPNSVWFISLSVLMSFSLW